MVETPVFIPFTKDSRLRKRLQELDYQLGEATNSPAARFFERCGGQTVADLLTMSNPWAGEWECHRPNCLPCKSRSLLTEEEASRPVTLPGQIPLPKPSKDEVRAAHSAPRRGLAMFWNAGLAD